MDDLQRNYTASAMKTNMPNGLVQLIAGRENFRVKATVIRRSGTGPAGRRAGRVPSLPMRSFHPHRQPAIPDEGRSATKYITHFDAFALSRYQTT